MTQKFIKQGFLYFSTSAMNSFFRELRNVECWNCPIGFKLCMIIPEGVRYNVKLKCTIITKKSVCPF